MFFLYDLHCDRHDNSYHKLDRYVSTVC